MLKSFIVLNGLFDYLGKVDSCIKNVNISQGSLYNCGYIDYGSNSFEIEIFFKNNDTPIKVNKDCIEVKNIYTEKIMNRKYNNVMDLIKILEGYRTDGSDYFYEN